MAGVEVRDETVIVVSRRAVAAVLAQRARWRSWWPQTEATVVADRGIDGMRWALSGVVVGVTEVVLVDTSDGVVIRYAMSVDPATPGSSRAPRELPRSPHGERELEALRRRQVIGWKRVVWGLKEELEGEPGMP